MCRYTIITLGLLSIIGSLVSLRFDGPVFGVTIACVFGVGLVLYGKDHERFSEMLPSVSKVALATGVVFTLVIVCFSEHISTKRSSRRALEMARRIFPHQQELTIGFPSYFPFSATFYGTAPGERPVKTILLENSQVASAQVDVILVRGDNAKLLMEAEPTRKVLGRVGRWTLFEGNTAAEPLVP
jgi:hypothetical protein